MDNDGQLVIQQPNWRFFLILYLIIFITNDKHIYK